MLNLEQFNAKYTYNPETGIILRLRDGISAVSIDKDWPVIRTNWEKVMAAKVAWLASYGVWPKSLVLPIDGDNFNLKLSNLRLSNRGAHRSHKIIKSSTGHKFIYKSGNNFIVRICVNNENKYLSSFNSLELAIEFRDNYIKDHNL